MSGALDDAGRLAGTGDPVREWLAGRGESGVRSSHGWIVSPLFDLLFFSNVYWVLVFLPLFANAEGEPYIHFWMAYFLATPHRWLTLVVAATDRDRRRGRTWLFVAIAVACALLIGGLLWSTGDFSRMFLFYTLLLGWHFAGQHATILKIYSRRSAPGIAWMENWLPMIFILYANVRLISFFDPMLRIQGWHLLQGLDIAMLALPIAMLAVELVRFTPQRLPKILYMVSCFGMWSSVLWAAHLHRDVLCSMLLAAVTIYHSVEYMAMVSYYAWHRQETGSAGLFQTMAKNWTVVFAWYVIGCGLLYSVGNAFFVFACFAVNTWASLLHCAYDGFMWRLRDADTAEAFGLSPPPAQES